MVALPLMLGLIDLVNLFFHLIILMVQERLTKLPTHHKSFPRVLQISSCCLSVYERFDLVIVKFVRVYLHFATGMRL